MMSKVNSTTGDKVYFPEISRIQYEGPESDNPMAFRYYDSQKVVRGRSMEEHFKFAVAYWHSFCGRGSDPFGPGTKEFPYDLIKDPLARAKAKMDYAFEVMSKLGTPFYCFHDYDLVDEATTFPESEKRLAAITDYALEKQTASGIKLLWGTANAFSHPRYMNGAATNPNFGSVAFAGAQIKNALDITVKLGGKNYVFWGGREGYMSLLNTEMKQEMDHLATFLGMARDYGRQNGFSGTYLIEPKPMEPMKHQYDFDAATVIGFLHRYGLTEDFKLNIEVNHATLAQHTFQHELQVAVDAGMLGSIDANRGDYQNGWDTDQFPNNLNEITEAMLVLLQQDVHLVGGINFDAKVRRNSTDPLDLFRAHIGGMDIFARALLVADRILKESDYLQVKQDRYRSFNSGVGKEFEAGNLSLEDLYQYTLEHGEPNLSSGGQEALENLINRYL